MAGVLDQARLPIVRHRSFPELDPRLFSFNSKHGWCGTCYGTGLKLAGFDEAQSGEEIWWNEWWDGDAEPCPVLRRAGASTRWRSTSASATARSPTRRAAR